VEKIDLPDRVLVPNIPIARMTTIPETRTVCRAFSYGPERACRFKSNIPRKIESDGLLCKALSY
jgi:hypothetical protein